VKRGRMVGARGF